MQFSRVPKVKYMVEAGVPVEAIPTYAALTDYANNKNGLCWPRMDTLAAVLGRSVRTIQRHLHVLRELGLVEFVRRRRWRGRYSSYLFRVCSIPQFLQGGKRRKGRKSQRSTTGHGGPVRNKRASLTGTKQGVTNPPNPPGRAKDVSWWFLGGIEKERINEEGAYQVLMFTPAEIDKGSQSPSKASGGRKRGKGKGKSAKSNTGQSRLF